MRSKPDVSKTLFQQRACITSDVIVIDPTMPQARHGGCLSWTSGFRVRSR